MSDFFDRIEQIRKYKKIGSINLFATQLLGYKSSEKINRLKTEGNMPSIQIVNDILKHIPEINSNWLITGEGEMLLQPPQTTEPEKQKGAYLKERRTKKNDEPVKDIPVYVGNTRAGTIQVYSDDPEMQTPIAHLPVNVFPGCNHGEKVNGDSMYPLIMNQAFVVGKIIDKRGIIYGEKYGIHTRYGQSMVKFIHPSMQGKEYIKIVSYNDKIPPQDIPIDDITFVYRVHFIINPS